MEDHPKSLTTCSEVNPKHDVWKTQQNKASEYGEAAMKNETPRATLAKGVHQWQKTLLPMSSLFFFLFFFCGPIEAKAPPPKGILPELQLNKKTESENLVTAAEAEALISKSEEKAIKQLEGLLKKYRGSSQEPDLLFRLAELYTRRAKTGRFVDLYRGEKTLAEILTPKLTEKGAKAYLGQAISNYETILQKFPKYAATDEVLFNKAFAYDQRGEVDEALKTFTVILEKFPNSILLPEAHMALGELYFQKQNYLASQKNYDTVQEWPNFPIAPIALYKSAWCSYNLKNTPEAIQKIEKLLLQSKKRPLVSHVRSEARRDLALFYSEVGSPDLSIQYFSKHLLEKEISLTVLDLAAIYERHGKLQEMVLVLNLLLKKYPEDGNSGQILMKLVQHHNEQHQHKLAIDAIKATTQLCGDEEWKKASPEAKQFCAETYPAQLKDLVAEWWEDWNKANRKPEGVGDLGFAFTEYLKFEPENQWNIGIHMSYADYLFAQKDFKNSYTHYEGVSRIEKLEPSVLHDSLYGAIVSLDRQLQEHTSDTTLRSKLQEALNNYLVRCPDGEYTDETAFKKAYLFYEEKDYIQSLEWLNKIKSKTTAMKEKQEDLILEIHRAKKDFAALVTSSLNILKNSTGERAKKIKQVYQSAQQAIIQELIAKGDLKTAASKSEAFYSEHKPEDKALDALHLAIELWEKTKKYRPAAEASETLAKEMAAIKKTEDAQNLSQHAVQLFLQLGDLNRAQSSLNLAIQLASDPSKKREAMELLADFSAWYGRVDVTEKMWQALEPQMNADEKKALLAKRLAFFEKQAPDKAEKLKQSLIAKGVEPFYSESQLQVVNKICDEKKWSQCYQLALKLNRDSTPPLIRAQARVLQSRVLVYEFEQQSLKASPDRLPMVMAYKAEKFDKAIQLLTTISQKSESLQIRKQGVQDLISLYRNYVGQLQKAMTGLDESNPDLASLKNEISQILPVLAQRPKELELALVELNKFSDAPTSSEKITLSRPFPELNGSEIRIYVPSWDESTPRRLLSEIVPSSGSCAIANIEKLSTLSALGREANSCLAKKLSKELEFTALRLSDLFPESPWGLFYLSVDAAQHQSMERSLWYLKLSEKRNKDSILLYEELRQNYSQLPDATNTDNLRKMDVNWNLTEDLAFLGVLDGIKQNNCKSAETFKKDLRSKFWASTPIDELMKKRCKAEPTRSLSSSESESQ